eukprot:2393-Heterococcus_DN1.PRE.3
MTTACTVTHHCVQHTHTHTHTHTHARCTAVWSTVPDAHVGSAQHMTSVSADVLLGITRHSDSAAAAGAAAVPPKLAWACQGSSGVSVWSTTLSQ